MDLVAQHVRAPAVMAVLPEKHDLKSWARHPIGTPLVACPIGAHSCPSTVVSYRTVDQLGSYMRL
jgi:hypothetical protein